LAYFVKDQVIEVFGKKIRIGRNASLEEYAVEEMYRKWKKVLRRGGAGLALNPFLDTPKKSRDPTGITRKRKKAIIKKDLPTMLRV